MTADEIRAEIVRALGRIAPEVDPATIRPSVSLRDQFDLDSMDLLNLMVALHTRFNVDIPEVDYPKLMTLDGAVAYVAAKTAAP